MLNIETKEVLGNGVNGTVYLCEYNGDDAVVKFENVDTNTPDNRYQVQVNFDREVAKLNPLFFTAIKMHGIVNDSNFVQPTPDFLYDSNVATRYKKRIKLERDLDYSTFSVQTPVMKTTMRANGVMIHSHQVPNLKRAMQTFNILKKAKWTHGDAHGENWMLDKNDKLWLIDYGCMQNKITPEFQLDVIFTLWFFAREPYWESWNKCGEPQLDDYETFLEKIKQETKNAPYLNAIPDEADDAVKENAAVLLCVLFDWELYVKCTGLRSKKFDFNEQQQPNKFMIAHIIRHLYDDNYDSVLLEIEKFTPFKILD